MPSRLNSARRLSPLLGVTLSVLGGAGLRAQDIAPQDAVRSVPRLDLDRYVGRWHEIARLPNRFQARCAAETTADYERLPDGGLRVVNTCVGGDGRMIRATGRARLAQHDGPASRLKVRFAPGILAFLPMVWGDYWVLDVTEDYSAALVGTPNRRYLWILSRQPSLDEGTYRRLVDTAAAQGFAVDSLIRSDTARPLPQLETTAPLRLNLPLITAPGARRAPPLSRPTR
jgi:apolipoprotein D and lipocalin family protein